MFVQWFRSKRVKVYQQQQQHYPQLTHDGAWDKAKKLGITVVEYNKRVSIIERELQHLTMNVGDTVFPSTWDDYMEHGRLLVRAVCRHYDQYGDLKWNEATPFVLQVSPLAKPGDVINCTVSWVSKEMPVQDTQHQDC